MAKHTALGPKIRAAAARTTITHLATLEYRGRHSGAPKRAGDLSASVLLFTDGDCELLLLALDLLELYEPWLERFHEALARYTGIPGDRQFVWCNHIHASPSSDGIAEIPLAERIAGAVDEARGRYAVAASDFVSRDLGSGFSINRRFSMGDLGSCCIMFNDLCSVEDVRLEVSKQLRERLKKGGVSADLWRGAAYCEAPSDVRLEMLSLRGLGNREPIAHIVRFPAHPAIASAVKIGNTLYPDYVGVLRGEIERDLGGVVLFLQGPSGDVRPLNEEYGEDAAAEYGRRLASQARRMAAGLKYKTLRRVGFARTSAALNLRPEYVWSEGRLKREAERARSKADGFQGTAADKLALWRRVEELDWVEFFRFKRPTIVPPKAMSEGMWRVGMAALGIGDASIAALPGEIFQQTGVRLFCRAKRRDLMITELFDSYISYLPSAEELGAGGYEDTSSFFASGAEAALLRAAMKAVSSVHTG